MGDNEELLTTELASTEEIIDVDDVEGHGLKEVAAGLGAAAVLAGGGAAAMSQSSTSLPDTPNRDSAIATVDKAGQNAWDQAISTTESTMGTADAAVESAATTAGAAARTAGAVAGGAVSTTHTLAGAAVKTTGSVADAAVKAAQGATATVDAAKSAATNVAKGAGQTATSAAAGAVDTATGVVEGVQVSNVTSTVNKTVSSVDLAGKTATVLKLTTTATAGALSTINAVLSDTGASAGASSGTGWVTFKVGDAVIGSVQIRDGGAAITVKTADLVGKTITATYSGDAVHASATNNLH